MVAKSRFTINTIESSSYTYYDSEKHYILDNDIKIGFELIKYAKTNQAFDEAMPYLYQHTYTYNPETGNTDYSSKYIETTPWNSSVFDEQIYKDQEKIIVNLYCLTNPMDVYLKGSASSQEFSYFTIEVYKYLWSECLSMDKFYDQMDGMQIRMLTQTSYLDFNDLANPLKKKGEMNFLSMNFGFYTRSTIKIAQNKYEIDDNYMFFHQT